MKTGGGRCGAVSPICEASVSRSAAFAAYWARATDQPPLVLPYKATGIREGGDLLRIWDAIDPDPTHDRGLVDRGARELGLQRCYERLPYSLDTGGAA